MPACPRDNKYSTLPPPGFTNANVTLKSQQLIELLEKVIDKCQHEPQFIEQQQKQTDLLISIAQFTLLSTPISSNEKRDFLNNILKIGQDLLTDENSTEIISSINSCSPSNKNKDSTSTVLPSDGDFALDDLANEYLQNEPTPSSLTDKPTTLTILPSDVDGDFSLDDLANEYLQNEPTPSSLTDKPITSSESEEPDLTLDDLSKSYLSSSSPSTNVLLNEPILIKPPLESILFSNRLSSHDAADDADCIWKEESSPFGQMFCKKLDENQIIPTKRISTCLLDRSLYERLTRLVNLLPKQCIRISVPQLSIRHNEQQQHRPPQRSNNNNNHRPSNRPSFQQNALQLRYPSAQNSRQYPNSNGYFVDRRSQQQNRYPPPSFTQHSTDQSYQQKGSPKSNSYNNNGRQQQPQNKKSQTTNQQTLNQHQQRGTKKGSGGGGGNKLTNEKSGTPGSDPSLTPK